MVNSKTNYLWEEILQTNSLLYLIENFVHVRTETDKIKQQVVKEKKKLSKSVKGIMYENYIKVFKVHLFFVVNYF